MVQVNKKYIIFGSNDQKLRFIGLGNSFGACEGDMSIRNDVEMEAESADPLAEKIRDSIIGVENIRSENRRLIEKINSLESAKLRLESESRSLKLALEHERAERRHYHSLANEIITRLDIVGQTVDDVVKRAMQEVHRQGRENTRADLPDVKAPSFLRKIQAALNGNGTEGSANPE